MNRYSGTMDRRFLMAGLGVMAATIALPQPLQAKGLGLTSLLGRASDSALDKLAVPGAFYDDEDIRIGLPMIGSLAGGGGLFGSIFGAANKLGLLDGLIRKLNRAAGVAAREAKPIFRGAIDDLTLGDVPGIVSQSDGATRYLQESAGDELHGKLRPHIDSALGDAGAYTQLDKLSAQHSFVRRAGISREGLSKSVTGQTLDGIFKYIGSEEAKLRANPLGKAGSLLNGVLGD